MVAALPRCVSVVSPRRALVQPRLNTFEDALDGDGFLPVSNASMHLLKRAVGYAPFPWGIDPEPSFSPSPPDGPRPRRFPTDRIHHPMRSRTLPVLFTLLVAAAARAVGALRRSRGTVP